MFAVHIKPLLLFFTSTRSRSPASRSMTTSAHRMFQLKVDPLTGNSEWLVIEPDIENHTTSEPLLATTSYLDMLNDAHRNTTFRQAIDKTVTESCHVLDIGAGTGLLSMMAARAMGLSNSVGSLSSNGMVTACESYLPMFKLMRKVLRANNMERIIRILNKRSDELQVGLDIPRRADVLVSEILDSELLGEGLIPTLQHAHDQLLVENPRTVPHCATTYAQLVECTYLEKLNGLVNREAETSDGIHLVPNGMAGLLGIKQKQYALHCDAIKEEIKVLSAPFKVFEFDFWRRPESSRETELHIKVTNDGTVHAIISWWVLQLDSEGTILYSTAPNWIHCASDMKGNRSWCDHWKQSIWFIPKSSSLPVFRDDEVHLQAFHTETSISYELKASYDKQEVSQDCQIVLSPERYALYGDRNWRHLMLNAIGKALHQTRPSLCLVADDSIFLTIAIAHLSNSSHVIALFPGLGNKVLQYLDIVAAANIYSTESIEIVKIKDLQLTLQDSHHYRKINLLVVEPFYYGNDNALPWQILRFWKQRTLLDSFLSNDVVIMPCRGLLKVCAMCLPDLWQSRRCLQEIEGFDHSNVNTILGACGNLPAGDSSPFLPLLIWQCGETKILSEMSTILEFEFSKPMSPCSGKAQVQFRRSGLCHGFGLWIDWVMDTEDNILSTGPDERCWKQAVKLLNKPVEVRDGGIMEIEAFFDASNGELMLQHTIPSN